MVKRWKRYGHDRLYVSDDAGQRVGWLDLSSGAITLDQPALARQFDAALMEYFGISSPSPSAEPAPATRPSAAAVPQPSPPPQMSVPCEDLSYRVPGQQAAREAERLRQQAPVASALGRVFGFATPDRSWRVGAAGERKVADELDKLRRRDPRWCVVHSVPVGERGSDIDHLVVGPGGVFTLNTKHHPGKRLDVRGDSFLVDGHRQPYVRNSRHEAERAARLLSAAVGFPVAVRGVVVPVGAASLVVAAQPADVSVVARRQLADWLSRTYAVLPPQAVAALFDAARRSTTWTARWGS